MRILGGNKTGGKFQQLGKSLRISEFWWCSPDQCSWGDGMENPRVLLQVCSLDRLRPQNPFPVASSGFLISPPNSFFLSLFCFPFCSIIFIHFPFYSLSSWTIPEHSWFQTSAPSLGTGMSPSSFAEPFLGIFCPTFAKKWKGGKVSTANPRQVCYSKRDFPGITRAWVGARLSRWRIREN